MKLILFIFVTFSILSSYNALFSVYPKIKNYPIEGDPGKPLILTPMIESGKIEEAQIACKNAPLKSNILSYSGFLTVNKKFNSNMFFWFFPAVENNETAPVALWLQGGPGSSSLFGLFVENGPFSITQNLELKLRKHTWTTSHSVIYIDNPVGTGFSFTQPGGYSKNEVDVGLNLYSALVQFFTLFPQYQKNDFFITGESYAGKYLPALAQTIDTYNPQAKLKINLQGIAIGNGLCDPENMLNYGDYLYQIGLLDSNGRDLFHSVEQSIKANIQQKKWKEALNLVDSLLNGDSFKFGSTFHNLTGFSFYFNYLHSKDYNQSGDMGRFFAVSDVRKNLHVGNITFDSQTAIAKEYLEEDVLQSVKPWVEKLLEKYRVLIYNGQLDIIVAFPLSEAFLDSLNWSGAAEYKSAPRKLWYVGDELAGYSKVAGKLTVVLVRDAGHMVPMDQPKWAEDLITRFTRNKPFSK